MKISKKDAIFKLLRACAPTGIEPMTFLTAGKRETFGKSGKRIRI